MRAASRPRPKDQDSDDESKKDAMATTKQDNENIASKVALVSANSEPAPVTIAEPSTNSSPQTPTEVLATLGDLGLEPLHRFDEFGGGAGVEALFILDLKPARGLQGQGLSACNILPAQSIYFAPASTAARAASARL